MGWFKRKDKLSEKMWRFRWKMAMLEMEREEREALRRMRKSVKILRQEVKSYEEGVGV